MSGWTVFILCSLAFVGGMFLMSLLTMGKIKSLEEDAYGKYKAGYEKGYKDGIDCRK